MSPWHEQRECLSKFVGEFCPQKGWSAQQELTYLDQCAHFSSSKLDAMSKELEKVLGPQDDLAIYACGSFGRLEARGDSDVDLLMLVRNQRFTPKRQKELCGILRKTCEAVSTVHPAAFEESKRIIIDEPNFSSGYLMRHVNGDTFRRWVPENFLLEKQFNNEDSLLRQVRRVSLLLESQPLTSNEFTRAIRKRLMKDVYGITENPEEMLRDHWVLFIREVLRFLHSSHLLHHHKTTVEGKPEEPRYHKLCLTRKMLGLSTFMLMLNHMHTGRVPSLLIDPPVVKLIRIVESDASTGRDRPSSLEILTCYAKGLSDIESIIRMPEQAREIGTITSISRKRTDFGQCIERLHGHLEKYVERYFDASGDSIGGILQLLM